MTMKICENTAKGKNVGSAITGASVLVDLERGMRIELDRDDMTGACFGSFTRATEAELHQAASCSKGVTTREKVFLFTGIDSEEGGLAA